MALSKTELNKRWRYNNRESYLACARRIKKSDNGRWHKYRYNARVRGYEFQLSFQEFCELLSECCYYCGDSEFVGIDRKENNLGYTKLNCVSACKTCNLLKRAMDSKSFIESCKKVSNKWGLGIAK